MSSAIHRASGSERADRAQHIRDEPGQPLRCIERRPLRAGRRIAGRGTGHRQSLSARSLRYNRRMTIIYAQRKRQMSIERMQTLLDDIATTLSCPVVLDDERQRLLAYTDHDVTADEVRVASILARRATPEIRTWFEQWGILEATAPVRTPADSGGQIAPRWVVPLRHEGMLLGFVSVLDRGRLTREQLEPVMESTAVIAETLYVARRAEPRVSALLQLLVLPRHSDDGDDVSTDVAAMYPHTGPIAVITFAVRRPLAGPRRHAGAAGCRPSRVPGLPGTDRSLCRAGRKRRCTRAPALRRRRDLRHPSGRSGHRSAPRIRPRRRCRRQLRHLDGKQRGQGLQRVHPRAAHRLWPIPLRPRSVPGITRSAFRALTLLPVAGDSDPIDPRVRALVAHPQLARTVETFLDNAGDAGTTARQLQIHRTTLYQRLNRVSDLCALDIQRSGDDRLAAHVGLRLATLARVRPA